MKMKISVVIPVKDEEENIVELVKEIYSTNTGDIEIETIVVDDGSLDDTFELLKEYQKQNNNLKIIKFRKNFGQTAAMSAGFKKASHDIIVAMDGDGQNDPRDIAPLVTTLFSGYDCVSGWRKHRKDPLSKKIPSRLSYWLSSKLIKVPIHDSGCSLKAYKKSALKDLSLYGEMHRFIPAMLFQQGYKIGEVVVNHRPRKKGKTKYNFKRILKGLLDLLYLTFWGSFSTRPLHFFGLLSFVLLFLSGLIVVEQIIKAFLIKALHLGPLLMLAVLFVVLGVLFLILGFISEIIIRNYYKDKESYTIEEVK